MWNTWGLLAAGAGATMIAGCAGGSWNHTPGPGGYVVSGGRPAPNPPRFAVVRGAARGEEHEEPEEERGEGADGGPELIPNWRPQAPSNERGGTSVGFEAVPGTGWVPPDAGLAVGPGHIVAIVNGQVAFFTKAGESLFRRPIAGAMGFWAECGAGGLVFDPEAHYDAHHDRFWLVACEQTGSGGYFELAVSKGPDPTQGWWKYRFDVSGLAGGVDIDSANLSVGPGAIHLSADFEAGGERTLVFIVPTAELLLGQVPGPSRSLVLAGVKGAALAARADTSGAGQYLVQAEREAGPAQSLTLHGIQNGLVAPQRFSASIPVPAYGPPGRPSQPGTSATINLYDARVWSAVCRDGSVWATHAVTAPGSERTVVRWYEFALGGWPGAGSATPTLRQWGEIDAGGGLHCFAPSIAVDARGHAALTYARSGPGEYLGMWMSRRRALDAPGTMRAPALVKGSTAPFTIYERWGDYTATATDPVDPCAFWGHGQWTTSSSDWRTWVGRYDNYADADADRSCGLNVQDFTAFLRLYATGDPRADADGSGSLNVQDFTAFLRAFTAGQ